MTLKNSKLSQTNKNLLDNFNLGEELEDKNGEKISGGRIFRFENTIPEPIDVILLNGEEIRLEIPAFNEAFNEVGTIEQEIPGNLITVQFSAIPGETPDNNTVSERMPFNRTGIFELEANNIVFFLQ